MTSFLNPTVLQPALANLHHQEDLFFFFLDQNPLNAFNRTEPFKDKLYCDKGIGLVFHMHQLIYNLKYNIIKEGNVS